MDHRHVDFGGGHGTGQGGVGVAIQHNGIGLFIQKNLLDAFDHLGGLYAMAGGTYVKVVVGARYAQLVKEDLRHVAVVVLTGVYDDLMDALGIVFPNGAAQCCCLDDLGPGPDDGDNLHSNYIMPSSARLKYEFSPIMRWSSTLMSKIFPAATNWRVMLWSSELGLATPEG